MTWKLKCKFNFNAYKLEQIHAHVHISMIFYTYKKYRYRKFFNHQDMKFYFIFIEQLWNESSSYIVICSFQIKLFKLILTFILISISPIIWWKQCHVFIWLQIKLWSYAMFLWLSYFCRQNSFSNDNVSTSAQILLFLTQLYLALTKGCWLVLTLPVSIQEAQRCKNWCFCYL